MDSPQPNPRWANPQLQYMGGDFSDPENETKFITWIRLMLSHLIGHHDGSSSRAPEELLDPDGDTIQDVNPGWNFPNPLHITTEFFPNFAPWAHANALTRALAQLRLSGSDCLPEMKEYQYCEQPGGEQPNRGMIVSAIAEALVFVPGLLVLATSSLEDPTEKFQLSALEHPEAKNGDGEMVSKPKDFHITLLTRGEEGDLEHPIPYQSNAVLAAVRAAAQEQGTENILTRAKGGPIFVPVQVSTRHFGNWRGDWSKVEDRFPEEFTAHIMRLAEDDEGTNLSGEFMVAHFWPPEEAPAEVSAEVEV